MDLVDLKISEKEIEQLSSCDVGTIFIGGIFGGVWRSSVLKDPKRLMNFCFIQIIVFLLICVFTLPIALAVMPNATSGIRQTASILQFLALNLGIAIAVLISWNSWMGWQSKRFRALMRLLDEIDRFHEMLEAIVLLDQLNDISRSTTAPLQHQTDLVEALQVTRDSLIAGLMTEKILRDNRGMLARRQDLLTSIETNLATLRQLDLQRQADDYRQFLNESLQISLSVHYEMQRLDNKPERGHI